MGGLFYNYFSYRYCIGNGYDIRYITNTIQTIGRVGGRGHRWYLRGKIDKFYANKYYVVGYLSTKNFKDDGLVGLEGEYDKEGYFIFNIKKRNIQSGLTRKKYIEKVYKIFGMKEDKIKYKNLPSFSLSCLFKS